MIEGRVCQGKKECFVSDGAIKEGVHLETDDGLL